MAEQLDISPEQRKIIEERTKRKLQLRNEFLKKRTDPFKHALGEGGTVFEPAYLRYQALRVSYFEYFRPTAKNGLRGFMLIVLPMFGFGYLVKKQRGDLETQIRNGEVAYKDRRFKFV